MAVAIPMVLLILFGYALTLDVDNVPLAIWDQDKTSISRDYILGFSNSPYFKVVGYFDDYTKLERQIDTGRALTALVIPKDFSQQIRARRVASVQLLADGSDSNTATIALGYARTINAAYNRRFIESAAGERGMRFSPPIDMQARVWFNPDMKSRNYIIPGLIAVIMMIISALLTSLTVAKEWERGTMEQLISTPIQSQELILGKFIPYFLIGFLDVVIAVAMGQFMFHVPLRGSVVLLFILSGLFLTGALCMGLFISIVTKSQFMATQFAFITTFLPAFLLSGFAFAITNMPKPLQVLTYVIPARYFVTILKGIYLKGVGVKVLWAEVVFLVLFSAIMVRLANMKFKKQVV